LKSFGLCLPLALFRKSDLDNFHEFPANNVAHIKAAIGGPALLNPFHVGQVFELITPLLQRFQRQGLAFGNQLSALDKDFAIFS
jgi:hypothetical protein